MKLSIYVPSVFKSDDVCVCLYTGMLCSDAVMTACNYVASHKPT